MVHLVDDSVLTQHILFGAAGAVGTTAAFITYLISRNYGQQKLALLAMLTCGLFSLIHFSFMTGGGSDHIYGKRVDWGLGTGYSVVFALVAAQSTYFFIMHDWASKFEICTAFVNGALLAMIMIAHQSSEKWVYFSFAVVTQLVNFWVGLNNSVRKDPQAIGYAVVIVAFKLAFHALVMAGPDGLDADGFTRPLYAWLYPGAVAVYIAGTAIYTLLFVEEESTYRARKGLPAPMHAEGASDAVPLHLMPGQELP